MAFTAVNSLSGVTGLRLRDFAVGTVIGIVAALAGLVLLAGAGLIAGRRHRHRLATPPLVGGPAGAPKGRGP